MKVLVAVDDSQFSDLAIQGLGCRPWWGDTQFRIVNVAAAPSVKQMAVWGLDIDWDLRERLFLNAQTIVDDHIAALKKMLTKDIAVEGKVIESQGQISDDIVREAEKWDADLIVVGSHGRTGLQKLLLGSVAEGVLSQAPCSVEIVKLQAHPVRGKVALPSQNAKAKRGKEKATV